MLMSLDIGPQTAGGTELVLMLVAGAAAAASQLFLRRDPNIPARDNKPTTLAIRGDSFVPLLLGRRRIGPVVGWAGNRTTVKESQGGKGGIFGGDIEVDVYYEKALHYLCVGEAARIERIYRDGKIEADEADEIWNVSKNPSGYASGDTVIAPRGKGRFAVYWGQDDQPVNTFLGDASRFGFSSRFPNVCYVVWGETSRGRRLSQAPNWPVIDYEVTRLPLSGFGAPDCLFDAPGWFGDATTGFGVNPAYALWEVLNRPRPFGVGIPAEFLDGGSFNEAATLCFNEGLRANILAKDGLAAVELIAQLLQEHGFALTQVQGRLTLIPVREQVNVPTITDDAVENPTPEHERDLFRRRRDRVTFVYDDETQKFKNGTVQIDSAVGSVSGNMAARSQRRQISTVTSPYVADIVARRLYLADLVAQQGRTFKMLRDARLLAPGQAFRYAGVQYRVVEAHIPMTGAATIKALRDIFSVAAVDYDPVPPPPPPPPPVAAPDYFFAPIELPADRSKTDEPEIIVPRVRANEAVTGGAVWLGDDDPPTEYVLVGTQSRVAAGGELESGITQAYAGVVEHGPVVVSANDDIANFAATISEALWLSGHRLVVVNGEVMAFRRVVSLGGNRWQIRGVIRGGMDEFPEAHAAGDKLALFVADDQARFTSPLLVNGFTSSWKTQPHDVDLGAVTARALLITDRRLRPRPVSCVEVYGENPLTLVPESLVSGRTLRSVNTYLPGNNIFVSWHYRTADGGGNASGEQGYGDAWDDDAAPSEGTFRVEMWDDPPTTIKGSPISVSADAETTVISNATLQAAFGGSEPSSFRLRVYSTRSGVDSAMREITVRKV